MTKYRFDQIALNSTEKKKPVEEDRFTYLGLEHLDSGSLKVARYGSEVAPIGEKLVMRKGDVLFGKRRAYQKKVAIAPFDGIFSAHGMVLRPKEDVVDKDFFPLFISSDYFLDAAIKISVGSLSPTINWRDLKELEFELPDLESQKRLASTLWAMNETMDSYKELIAATDELVKSQFIEMTEKANSELKKLDELSSEWLKGQAFKKDEMIEEGDNSCIHYGELFTKYGPIIDAAVSRTNAIPVKISQVGDILFPASDVTPMGLTKCSAILEAGVILGGDIIVMRPKKGINTSFLSYAIRFQEEQLLSRVTGSLVRHISAKSLKTVTVPIPDIDIQDEFVVFARHSDKSKFTFPMVLRYTHYGYSKLSNYVA